MPAFRSLKIASSTDTLDVNTGFGFTDMFLGATLGWHFETRRRHRRLQPIHSNWKILAGRERQHRPRHMGNEFTIGSTVYLDQKRLWNAAGTFALNSHTDKSGTNIQVGDMATVSELRDWGELSTRRK